MADLDFDRSVFVNCPFDEEYKHILQAILFCLIRFGLWPRIASEKSDAGEARIDRIFHLIVSSRYSIHDLSRSQAREAGEYYRLNMPFELGIDYCCRRIGKSPLRRKQILILEEKRYRYQAAISDLSGSDIEVHDGNHEVAVRKVRNWLVGSLGFEKVGPARILAEYEDFQQWHYEKQLEDGFSEEDIQDYPTAELLQKMTAWVEQGGLQR